MESLTSILELLQKGLEFLGGGVAVWGLAGVGMNLYNHQSGDLQNNFMKIGGGAVVYLAGAIIGSLAF